MQVHALSMRLNRDIESVEADIEALLKAGVLDGDGRQGVIFPYDEIFLNLPTTARSTL